MENVQENVDMERINESIVRSHNLWNKTGHITILLHLAADFHCIYNIEKLAFFLMSGSAQPPPPNSYCFISLFQFCFYHLLPLLFSIFATPLFNTLIAALLSPPYLTVDCCVCDPCRYNTASSMKGFGPDCFTMYPGRGVGANTVGKYASCN